jgi:pyruvate formate lyase activating enzyme
MSVSILGEWHCEAMVRGVIFDIRKYSIHDGPGIRTTVFFKGCPLSCVWCHNPESQSFQPELIIYPERCIRCGACLENCPQRDSRLQMELPYTDLGLCTHCGACVEACTTEARRLVGREMSVEQVMQEIERDRPFYEQSGGGVTFSGGEPLSQGRFLLALLKACKRLELHTALDTCGFSRWETLDQVRKYVDLFLYDLKLVDDARHRQFTGASNRLILANLERLAQSGHRIILRVPLIPGVTDGAENLGQIGALAGRYACIERLDLLPYHPTARGKYENLQVDYPLAEMETPDEEMLRAVASRLHGYGIEVQIGG